MKARPGPQLLTILILALASGAPGQSPPQVPAKTPTLPDADPLLENLEGADAEKGALAARDLLAQIVDAKSKKREAYLAYLKRALDRERLAQGGAALPIAERLVAAMGYTAASGQPFPPEGAELATRLLGAGGEGIRKVVHEAVFAFARAGNQKVLGSLGAMLLMDPPPEPAILEEAADILWRVNAKELVRSLISVVAHRKASPAGELAPYLLVLRQRLDLNFSTIDEWERWWAENQDNSIEGILESAHRQYRARQAELWRKILRRLEAAGDPEAYLGGIGDALEVDSPPELRAAAVEALGTLLDWMRDARFSPEKSAGTGLDEARRSALASRGVSLLLKLVGGEEGHGLVLPEVRRKALAALRSYAPHLARSARDEAAVSEALLQAFRNVLPDPAGGVSPPPSPRGTSRADLLELVRTAGALRIPAARPYLERILRDDAPRAGGDLQFLVETVNALGRVLERGVTRESVDLILGYFRAHRDATDKVQRDLRRACVASLNLRIEDAALRDDLRRFYNEVLANPEDKVGRVPAILGLGILAKGVDSLSPAQLQTTSAGPRGAPNASGDPSRGPYREAVADLASVLARRSQFEPAEATAAVDALAYLGGREALEQLLPFIDAKDKPFAGHVWRKVVSLVKGQGLDLLRWTLMRLEEIAFQNDEAQFAALALELTEEPELASLLLSDRAGAAGPAEFVAFWEASLARARAMELTGDDSRAGLLLLALNDLLIKNGRVKEMRPQAEEELNQARSRLTRMVAAKAVIARTPPAAPEALAEELLSVLVPADRPEARWRAVRRLVTQLQALQPTPQSVRAVEVVLAALSAERNQSAWRGISAEARGRALKALEALRDKLKNPPAGN